MPQRVRALALALPLLVQSHPVSAAPRGPDSAPEVAVPRDLLLGKGKKPGKESSPQSRILAANPRLYTYPDLDPKADKTLVVGLPGWGGRSENFIWSMINGLARSDLTRRLVLAALQDPVTSGPRYQGQGDQEHANVWELDEEAVAAVHFFLERLSGAHGRLNVYFLGFSSGARAAPQLVVSLARSHPRASYTLRGAISLGATSWVDPEVLKAYRIRLLYLTVPARRKGEARPMRDDQYKRIRMETISRFLSEQGTTVYLRHVASARRHVDWHWGLMSQCRFFRSPRRLDEGRGFYPHYWMPNPETWSYIGPFLAGKAPPEEIADPPSDHCPY